MPAHRIHDSRRFQNTENLRAHTTVGSRGTRDAAVSPAKRHDISVSTEYENLSNGPGPKFHP